jgi:ferritin
MLEARIENALNDQIAMECTASFVYLSMANWCEQEGLSGCAQFLFLHSEEERNHMLKLIHYINSVDGKAVIPQIKTIKNNWEGIRPLLEEVYEHEKKVTASIHEIVAISQELKDFRTQNFLQWYVDEQLEEETLVKDILDTVRLIGNGPQSLYYINKELEKRCNAEEAEAEA